nr:hypothetical protein [uncultured Acinetobacter sp.]
MNIDNKVSEIIQEVNAGKFDHLANTLDNGDLGIYIPAYVDNGEVKLMKPGFSQSETDLKITINPQGIADPSAKTIAWMGKGLNDYSYCKHPGTGSQTCKHKNGHGDCFHCTRHFMADGIKSAEGLDYSNAISALNDKQQLLDSLSTQNIGLTLLHAHSAEHEFTKLPDNIVSVIYDGYTTFRNINDVKNDSTFVPNAWRFINGKLEIAGGFSFQEA